MTPLEPRGLMSPATFIRLVPLSALAAAVLACGDSRPSTPAGGADPLKDRVQLQSPDTARGGNLPSPPKGDGSFRGSVVGYSLADLPDTLKNAKPLANVSVA